MSAYGHALMLASILDCAAKLAQELGCREAILRHARPRIRPTADGSAPRVSVEEFGRFLNTVSVATQHDHFGLLLGSRLHPGDFGAYDYILLNSQTIGQALSNAWRYVDGWVDFIDSATGHDVHSCILSVQASKDEFAALVLDKVDPKACFKLLKGVGSSQLHSLTPIAPIMAIDREDRRFVSSYDIVDTVDETDNLAAMDWQDFENLIREIFERDFATSGVK